MNLSKTLYIRGLQCDKSLWLKKHKSSVLTPPDSKIQSLFDGGHRFGELACKLFPNGKEIVFKGTTFNQKLSLTKQWIEEGVENIYEATFQYNGVLCLVDILHVNEDGTVEINEVKNTSEIRDVYLNDAAIQYYVINGLGYKVSKTTIIHRNAEYDGDDLEKIFSIVDVSDEIIALQAEIPNYLERFEKLLLEKVEPDIDMGEHCLNPYCCDARDYCKKMSLENNASVFEKVVNFLKSFRTK